MKSIDTVSCEGANGCILQGTMVFLDNGDIIVAVTGGKDHVGAVSLAVPRTSLQDPGRVSATSSVMTMIGHKDDEVAKYVGEKIAAATGKNTVVVAGIHFDNASSSDLEILRELWVSLTRKMLLHIKEKSV